MRAATLRYWSTILAFGIAGHLGLAGHVAAIGPWERWTVDPPLVSSVARTPLQAYHDMQIEATFWRKSGSTCTEPAEGACTNANSCFKGLAFWDGDTASPGRFLLRSAFPDGTWCWKTCLLPKTRPDPNGPSLCTADSGLNRNGEVALSTAPSVPSPLYSAGFLKAPPSKRNLTTWNGQTSFQWLGDTAWNAPIRYSSDRVTWKSYVGKRATGYDGNTFDGGGGFTNVLVAPAVQTVSAPPTGGFRGFVAPAGCGAGSAPVVPASCHYWDSAYWRDVDDLVKVANDAGIVVVVADLMDPLNRGGSNQRLTPPVLFPARADAMAFARNLAARLAGSFVVFSPSFDAKAGDATAEAGVLVKDLIDAVGGAIHVAAPRQLIGVHLAGGSALSDYDTFQDASKTWLNLQIFQSGHGGGTCETGVGNDYAQFACRARKFALRFRCIGEAATSTACAGSGAPPAKPIKPAVNVEGQYETPGDNETRVQTRHTGWNSGLSGSFGFDIGVFPDITAWTNPATYNSTNHKSDDDLGRMKGLFKSMPWTGLAPHSDMLVELNSFSGPTCDGVPPLAGVSAKADWLQLWKPHLVLDIVNTYGLAYLPRPATCRLPNGTIFRASTTIAIDRAKANGLGFNCGTWAGKWVSPGETAVSKGGFGELPAKCSDAGSGPITFTEDPQRLIGCGPGCDRVLRLTKRVKGSDSSPNIVAGDSVADLEAEVELSDDGLTSTIVGQIRRNGLPIGDPIPLSGPELRFRKLPAAALDAAGNFLVAWEEENGAGSDDVVAARFNARGEPLGSPVVLNDTTDGQQAEPWLSGDDSGSTVAVWTSYSEDDEIAGDIYGKVLDASGQPMSSEFLISTDNLGNQSMAQVQMDGDGGFVVAWTEDPPADSLDVVPPDAPAASLAASKAAPARGRSGGVYYRAYDATGRARGPERHVESGSGGWDRLSRLEVHRHGGFTIHWRATDASGQDRGEGSQECDRDGNPGRGH